MIPTTKRGKGKTKQTDEKNTNAKGKKSSGAKTKGTKASVKKASEVKKFPANASKEEPKVKSAKASQ